MRENVAYLPIPKPRAVAKRRRKLDYTLMTSCAIGACAATVTGLSLSHLATGITAITHCPEWQGWSMAIAVDIGFVSLELAQLTIADKVRAKLARYFRPTILGTLAWSAALNALAFAGQANSIAEQAMGVALGLSIPVLIYLLTRIGGGMYLSRR